MRARALAEGLSAAAVQEVRHHLAELDRVAAGLARWSVDVEAIRAKMAAMLAAWWRLGGVAPPGRW